MKAWIRICMHLYNNGGLINQLWRIHKVIPPKVATSFMKLDKRTKNILKFVLLSTFIFSGLIYADKRKKRVKEEELRCASFVSVIFDRFSKFDILIIYLISLSPLWSYIHSIPYASKIFSQLIKTDYCTSLEKVLFIINLGGLLIKEPWVVNELKWSEIEKGSQNYLG